MLLKNHWVNKDIKNNFDVQEEVIEIVENVKRRAELLGDESGQNVWFETCECGDNPKVVRRLVWFRLRLLSSRLVLFLSGHNASHVDACICSPPVPPSNSLPRVLSTASSFFFFFFLGPHPQHMEIPGPGVESELQLLAYTTATATWDLSHIHDLHHSSQ